MEFLTLILVIAVIIQVAQVFGRLDRLDQLVSRLARSPGDGAGGNAMVPAAPRVKQQVPVVLRDEPEGPPAADFAGTQRAMRLAGRAAAEAALRKPPAEPPPIPVAKAAAAPAPLESPAPAAPRVSAPLPAPWLAAGTEQLVGGKAASFVGIAALVTGIVMFVGYAIQHKWIGPAMRVLLGLICGLSLAALGHLAEARGRNLRLLARVLTGGGAALFYFSVFAAYHMYQLISAPLAAAGLAASAAAVFWLSLVYASEAVAMLGLAGAFLTPQLAGGDFAHGVFPLAFVAVVNVPAIVLGIRKRWLVLANSAFVFTCLMVLAWLGAQPNRNFVENWPVPLSFCGLYYAEFLVLGVARMRPGRGPNEYALDLLRLTAGGTGLVAALYGILALARLQDAQGGAFAVAAACHGALIWKLRRSQPAVTGEMLYFWIAAIVLAALAVPLHFHGVWVSLGWALAGFVLCPLALREQARPLSAIALGLGLLGVAKSLFFDTACFAEAPRMFLNTRFAVGLAGTLLLYVQSLLHARDVRQGRLELADTLPVLCAFLLTAFALSDVFWTQDARGMLAWMLSSAILLCAGISFAAAGRPGARVRLFGLALLPLVPVKILLVDTALTWPVYADRHEVFLNAILWLRLAMILAAGCFLHRAGGEAAGRRFTLPTLANILTIAAALCLLTLECWRMQSHWRESLITLLWAASAMTMVAFGLIRHRPWFRYAGLLLFTITVAKVFLFDFAGLSGLPRVGAFTGVGVLLLLLSFAYQRLAPVLTALAPVPRTSS